MELPDFNSNYVFIYKFQNRAILIRSKQEVSLIKSCFYQQKIVLPSNKTHQLYIENHAPDPFSLVLSLHYDFMNYIIFELSESKSESINPIKTICQGFCHFKLKKQKDDFRNKKIACYLKKSIFKIFRYFVLYKSIFNQGLSNWPVSLLFTRIHRIYSA